MRLSQLRDDLVELWGVEGFVLDFFRDGFEDVVAVVFVRTDGVGSAWLSMDDFLLDVLLGDLLLAGDSVNFFHPFDFLSEVNGWKEQDAEYERPRDGESGAQRLMMNFSVDYEMLEVRESKSIKGCVVRTHALYTFPPCTTVQSPGVAGQC